ncbi:cytochrome c oxidase assembly protein [Micromonospora sp. U21]|uniref:cytochrome c oxidase assembly protein n=1 Tax=Micromonospora sp. U21 TaxID=2824899 RepID=UPI001B36DFFD|nr:cytochrome c oxidase assembly protein [Micromonospora sp. U21]MBQ0905051.1 cytochrome c oxidase assembly protein [Micromonospora sp. U21]
MSALSVHQAHGPGQSPLAESLLAMLVVVTVCLLAAGYGRGVQELWSRRGAGHVVPRWRVAAFGAGLLVVLGTEHGPAHEMAESSLAGHMAQHMLLLLVAGPLLAAGAAGLPLSMAVPLPLRRLLARCRVAPPMRRLRHPGTYALLAGGGQTVVLWFWHLPGPYAAAVDRPAVHATEHLCFLATAWLFWAPVLGSPRHRAPAPVTVLLLAGTMLPASALGAVLTFAPQPIYPRRVFGADPLPDQQLAGLLMWAPMDLAVLVVALTVFLGWLLRMDRDRPDGLRGGPPPGGTRPMATTAEAEGVVP